MGDPRIVVLGAAGMLGHKMFQTLRTRFRRTTATIREDLNQPPLRNVDLLQGENVFSGVDATNLTALRSLLTSLQPTFIINCIGIIKQRPEATAPIPSIALNALLPHCLCQWSRDWDGRVIHFSTDCVFNGRKGYYREDDRSDVDDLYGRTKFLGEVAGDNGLTLRTSIIGRELCEHRSLLDWFLSQRGKAVSGYSRVIYSGVTTNYLARIVRQIIETHPKLSGLYHVASEPITKYELLCLIKEAYDLNITIIEDATEVSDRSLLGDKFVEATGIVTPPWAELVRELRDDPTPYGDWIGR